MLKIKNKKIFSTILFLSGFFLYGNYANAEALNLPKDENGWTIFTPSVDSDVVYVDSVLGDDVTCRTYRTSDVEMGANPFIPVGPILPCATSAKAVTFMGGGQPDWMLYKRGSIFDTGIVYARSGRSATEPTVVGAYGASGELPIFRGGYDNNGNVDTHWLAIAGLDFYADFRDPNSPNYAGGLDNSVGLWFFSHEQYSMKGILVEGCKFRFFKDNAFQPVNASDNSGLTIRRNLFADNYSISSAHSQGLLVSNFNGLLIEENVFDHNGWLVQNDSDGIEEVGEATIFNHNTYLTNNKNLIIRNNIFAQGSSNNSKIKYTQTGIGTGLVVDNNLYIGGEIAISIGAPDEHEIYSVVNPFIANNVYLKPGYANPTNREIGWFFYNFNWDGGTVTNNYMLHQDNDLFGGHFFHLQYSGRNVNVSNNIVYDTKNITPVYLLPIETGNPNREGIIFEDNVFDVENNYIVDASALTDSSGYSFVENLYYSTKLADTWFRINSSTKTNEQWMTLSGDNSTFGQKEFTDPSRSIESYMTSIGEIGAIENFIFKIRSQNKYNWDNRFAAENVNSYIKAGFVFDDIFPPSVPVGLNVL